MDSTGYGSISDLWDAESSCPLHLTARCIRLLCWVAMARLLQPVLGPRLVLPLPYRNLHKRSRVVGVHGLSGREVQRGAIRGHGVQRQLHAVVASRGGVVCAR